MLVGCGSAGRSPHPLKNVPGCAGGDGIEKLMARFISSY